MTAPAQTTTTTITAGKAKRPPRLKGGLPLIGHTLDFAKDALRDLLALQDKLVTMENIQKTVAEYFKIRSSTCKAAASSCRRSSSCAWRWGLR